MVTLHSLTKLTDTKFYNLYCADVENSKKRFFYYITTKRKKENMAILTKKIVSDSVRVLPYFYDKQSGEMKVVIIREYRYPVGQFLYTLPAGGIEQGENIIDAVKRELKEEIGAETINIKEFEPVSYIAGSLTDEAITLFEAEVILSGEPQLEDNEIIERHIINFEEISNFLDTHEFCMQSRTFLRSFYYKTKYKQLLSQKNIIS
jgi:ADP-ribose pyrophosphatase